MTTVEQHSQFQINNINDPQLSPAIEKCLDNIIISEGFIKHTKYERAITTNGGNYLGDLFEVDIKGKTLDGDKETNLFLKRIISGEGINLMSTSDLQEREIMAYGELYRLSRKLMDEANIPENERFQQAKCYGANSEVLIFENLAVKGFKTIDKTEPVSMEYAELAIKQLAKFHGLSFALQKKNPEYFNAHIKSLDIPMDHDHEDYDKITLDAFNKCCELVDENSKRKLKSAMKKIINKEKYFVEKESKICLCHGDYRTNNLLVKEEEGVITDIVPVDFQLIYFGNPMNDFLYFLIPHSDQEFRRNHLSALKDLYYETLGDFLKYFDIDVAAVYPRRTMEQDYEERLGFGLLSGMLLVQFLFPSDDSIPNMNDVMKNGLSGKLQDGAKERIQGIVNDYINWGFL